MDTAVMVALISGGFAFLGALLSSALANSKTLYRIDQLEKKMDLHNNAVVRLTQLEVKVGNLEREAKK